MDFKVAALEGLWWTESGEPVSNSPRWQIALEATDPDAAICNQE